MKKVAEIPKSDKNHIPTTKAGATSKDSQCAHPNHDKGTSWQAGSLCSMKQEWSWSQAAGSSTTWPLIGKQYWW